MQRTVRSGLLLVLLMAMTMASGATSPESASDSDSDGREIRVAGDERRADNWKPRVTAVLNRVLEKAGEDFEFSVDTQRTVYLMRKRDLAAFAPAEELNATGWSEFERGAFLGLVYFEDSDPPDYYEGTHPPAGVFALELTWNPEPEQLGTHDFEIQLYNRQAEQVGAYQRAKSEVKERGRLPMHVGEKRRAHGLQLYLPLGPEIYRFPLEPNMQRWSELNRRYPDREPPPEVTEVRERLLRLRDELSEMLSVEGPASERLGMRVWEDAHVAFASHEALGKTSWEELRRGAKVGKLLFAPPEEESTGLRRSGTSDIAYPPDGLYEVILTWNGGRTVSEFRLAGTEETPAESYRAQMLRVDNFSTGGRVTPGRERGRDPGMYVTFAWGSVDWAMQIGSVHDYQGSEPERPEPPRLPGEVVRETEQALPELALSPGAGSILRGDSGWIALLPREDLESVTWRQLREGQVIGVLHVKSPPGAAWDLPDGPYPIRAFAQFWKEDPVRAELLTADRRPVAAFRAGLEHAEHPQVGLRGEVAEGGFSAYLQWGNTIWTLSLALDEVDMPVEEG